MTQSVHEARPASFMPSDDTFGARLALLRQHMRWGNVARAAQECGLPVESWRNWEEGRSPRQIVEAAKAISLRTGCDLDWLVFGPSRAQLAERMAVTPRYAGVRRDAMSLMPANAPAGPYSGLRGPLPDKMTLGPIGPSTAPLKTDGRPTLVRPRGI